MLGWEFPPAFTGGLGVACYGIVKALHHSIAIHLVIPQSVPHVELDGVQITGLNQLDSLGATEELSDFDYRYLVNTFHRLPVGLTSYPRSMEKRGMRSRTLQESFELREIIDDPSATWADVAKLVFSGDEIYGYDISYRTHLYARLVDQISSKIDFDIVHAHDWPTFEAALAVKQSTGKPLVLHIHSLETDRAGENIRNAIYDLEKYAMINADQIIAVSQYTKNQIVRLYQIDPDKINVVHNGSEPALASSFKKKVKEKWIVFVGRITSQKGPNFLLQTAEKLVKVCPEARFVVAGDGDMFPHLITEVAYKKLGKYFIFTGFLSKERINDLLAVADIYFMPSISEPFGLSALEAAQQNVPSVISNRSGAAEVLINTLQADFWDTDKFADYLNALIHYPALKKEIKAKLNEDIKSLTWENAAKNILKVYDQAQRLN